MTPPRLVLLISSLLTSIAVAACDGGFDFPEPTATAGRTPAATGSQPGGSTGAGQATGAGNTGAAPTQQQAGTGAGGGGLNQERYTVVAGDAPSIIAEKVGVPVEQRQAWIEELLAINDVTATTLRVGMELILPPTP